MNNIIKNGPLNLQVYIDGLMQTTTARMLDPYLINNNFPVIKIENEGINYFTEERLKRYMEELQSIDAGKGFDFNVHAIGDRGIRQVSFSIIFIIKSQTSFFIEKAFCVFGYISLYIVTQFSILSLGFECN